MTDSSDKEAVLAANEAFYRAFSNRDLSLQYSIYSNPSKRALLMDN